MLASYLSIFVVSERLIYAVMDKLDTILKRAVADGEDTKDKLLGAAFIVTDRKGKQSSSYSFLLLKFCLNGPHTSILPHYHCITYGNP